MINTVNKARWIVTARREYKKARGHWWEKRTRVPRLFILCGYLHDMLSHLMDWLFCSLIERALLQVLLKVYFDRSSIKYRSERKKMAGFLTTKSRHTQTDWQVGVSVNSLISLAELKVAKLKREKTKGRSEDCFTICSLAGHCYLLSIGESCCSFEFVELRIASRKYNCLQHVKLN